MINFKNKISIIFIGLIVILLILEIALRIIGYVHIKRTEDKKTVDKDDYVILCVGDSFTEGTSAPNKSYPEQLEDILNSRVKGKRFTVINKGVSSYNTSQILEEFKKQVDDIKPDLVILLAGGANFWNYWGYSRYLRGETLYSKLCDLLFEIKIFKLFKLSYLNINRKLKNNRESKEKEKRLTGFKVNEFRFYENRAYDCKIRGKNEEAIKWYKKALEIKPKDINCIFEMAELYVWMLFKHPFYRKNEFFIKEANRCIKKVIEIAPENFISYRPFIAVYRMDGIKIITLEDAIKFLYGFEKDNLLVKDIISIMSKKENMDIEIFKWVADDIKSIIDLCNKKDINTILQNYPLNYNYVTLIVKDLSRAYSVLLVDHNRYFRILFSKAGEIKKNYFVQDGHCNAKGYRVMAENIYNKIIEEKLIDLN